MKLKVTIVLAVLLSLFSIELHAQQVDWSVDFNSVFNNREGGDEAKPDQTFIFTRLAPEIGLSLLGGEHQLRAGVSWYQPLTDDASGYKVIPTIYYRYNTAGWHVALGMLPRTLQLAQDEPYMRSDSLQYLQPNIRGALIQHTGSKGWLELGLDWRQVQSTTKREAFDVTLSGHYTPREGGPLYLGGHVRYNHLAKRKGSPEEDNVIDNVTINPMIGLDLSHRTALDSLRIAAGAIVKMDRNRLDMTWHTPAAALVEATAQWKWIGVQERLSAGKSLMPLYSTFGNKLYLGDQYYDSKVYSRTTVWASIVSNRCIDLRASLSYHATDKVTGFWQQIAVRMYIDNKIWKRRHDSSYLKSERLANCF